MGVQFSHAVGYRGVCKLFPKNGSNDGVIVLCTGGNINLTQDPIMASGVWGAGYANAAPIAYAWNYLNLEGSTNFQLTVNKDGTASDRIDVWSALKQYAFDARTANHRILMLPDGKNGFDGNGWLSSLSFDASEGAAITGTFNFRGDPDPNSEYNNGTQGFITYKFSGDEETSDKGQWSDKSVNSLAGATLVPYWSTTVGCVGSGSGSGDIDLSDVISWSCSYNSDIQMLKCCNAQGSAPLSADYILLGEMSGDGNYTIFRIKGDFDPEKYHTEKKYLTFGIGSTSNNRDRTEIGVEDNGDVTGVKKYIQIPLAIVNSASTSMTTGASYVTAEFSFTALGDGINPIMKMESKS